MYAKFVTSLLTLIKILVTNFEISQTNASGILTSFFGEIHTFWEVYYIPTQLNPPWHRRLGLGLRLWRKEWLLQGRECLGFLLGSL